MTEVRSRTRRRTALERVSELLRGDFPDVDVPLSTDTRDLWEGRARAVVLEESSPPIHPDAGCDHMVFPAASRAAGIRLLFRAADRLVEALRRFYLPPVVLAGAGPGGVATMTVAATRALADADVVLTDALCGEEVLRFTGPDAVVVSVGKRCGTRSATQGQICARMVDEARLGRRVVRLKGGDPSVFGRLEEEISALAGLHLSYRVLPGIGAASGAAAFIGQPLTARNVASELILSTGRLAGGGKNPFPLDGSSAPAIALYMSRKVLAERMSDLLGAGYPPTTPAVVVEQLGSPSARAVEGTIETLADDADQAGVGTPAVVLVGAQYGQPDHLPLHGVRVWLPAEAETAGTQRERLEELGAVCVERPLIEPVALPVEEGALLARPFDWVVFTSKKSPDFLFALLRKWGYDARWLPRVAAIGDPTIAKLRARGIEPDLVPSEPTRAALSAALVETGLQDRRVLIPASAVAPDHVRKALEPHAASVVRVDLYSLHFPRVDVVPAADVVLFSSESTVRAAVDNGLVDEIRRREMVVGGIGPATWRAIEEAGLPLSILPEGTDPGALARATHLHFARKSVADLGGRAL